MRWIAKAGSFQPTREVGFHVVEDLPAGNYTVSLDPRSGFFLTPTEGFKPTGKVYGKVGGFVDRIVDFYKSVDVNVGVLARGEKGSGKTMMVKLLSERLSHLPRVIVTNPYTGDSFMTLIESLPECILVFDEVDKVYSDRNAQDSLLTMFDGVLSGGSKKLFVLTANTGTISYPLINRPSRMRYDLVFGPVERTFTEEFLDDQLPANRMGYRQSIVDHVCLSGCISFDGLTHIVKEIVRYGSSDSDGSDFNDLISILNVDKGITYKGGWKFEFRTADGAQELWDPVTVNFDVQHMVRGDKYTAEYLHPAFKKSRRDDIVKILVTNGSYDKENEPDGPKLDDFTLTKADITAMSIPDGMIEFKIDSYQLEVPVVVSGKQQPTETVRCKAWTF